MGELSLCLKRRVSLLLPPISCQHKRQLILRILYLKHIHERLTSSDRHFFRLQTLCDFFVSATISWNKFQPWLAIDFGQNCTGVLSSMSDINDTRSSIEFSPRKLTILNGLPLNCLTLFSDESAMAIFE